MKFSQIKWRWFGIPVLAVAMLLASDTSESKAQGFSLQVGRFGISSYGGNRGYRGYGSSRSYRPGYNSFRSYHYGTPIYRSNYRSSYRSNYQPSYRSYHPATPHYDYHPPTVVPHGNHLDYVPGHYNFHYGHH